MIRKINFLLKLFIVFVVFSVSGCTDSEKDKKEVTVEAEKVSKKISIPINQEKKAAEKKSGIEDQKPVSINKEKLPVAALKEEEASKTLEVNEAVKVKGDLAEKVEKPLNDSAKEPQQQETSRFIKNLLIENDNKNKDPGTLDHASLYDPTGRINPFSPLIKEEVEQVKESEEDDTPKRPKTPLEKYDLSQLKLVAVIETNESKTALLEESSGKGYLVEKGNYVGLNSGQIVGIESDRIIIKETIKDISGKSVTRESVLQIQKPVGE